MSASFLRGRLSVKLPRLGKIIESFVPAIMRVGIARFFRCNVRSGRRLIAE
jgi:hypothetical protein